MKEKLNSRWLVCSCIVAIAAKRHCAQKLLDETAGRSHSPKERDNETRPDYVGGKVLLVDRRRPSTSPGSCLRRDQTDRARASKAKALMHARHCLERRKVFFSIRLC